MNTIKAYYLYPDIQCLTAKIINIYGEYIELNSTIAFSEGGRSRGRSRGNVFKKRSKYKNKFY
jgi:hypothetical protein